PVRRQMDYLRMLGASKESAKELKLYGLGSFFVNHYSDLSDQIYTQNMRLARRRLLVGALLSWLSTAGYYAAYAYVIYWTVKGRLIIGTRLFLPGEIAGAKSNRQKIVSLFCTNTEPYL